MLTSHSSANVSSQYNISNNVNKIFINEINYRFPASEMVVTRSFPLASLVREKKLTAQYLPHLNSLLPECIQLRSVTFQVKH
jgi:hypothetical protein